MNRLFLLLFSLCQFTSCAGGRFRREWQAALAQPNPDATGAWEGHWRSGSNHHTGSLRCLVEASEADPALLKFRYEATWGEFFRGYFDIQCRAVRHGAGRWTVSGTKDLGKLLGGPFSHEADLTPLAIHARYSSRLDQGVMEMTRPRHGEISTKSANLAD